MPNRELKISHYIRIIVDKQEKCVKQMDRKQLNKVFKDYGIKKTYTGRFIMFSVITNIYNKKTKGPTLMELFTATGKLKKPFLTTRDVRYVHHG